MNAIKKICNAAVLEQNVKRQSLTKWVETNSDKEEGELTEIPFAKPRLYLNIVHLFDEPINFDKFIQFDPNIKLTRGLYTIQYLPMGHPQRNPKFPFLIGQDLVRIRITVSSFLHWRALCDRIPELGWLKRNSTLTSDMFRLAKMHPGLVLRFGIDYAKYCDKITKRAEELGIDIDHKPLCSYIWNQDFTEKHKHLKIGPVKGKKDYEEVLEKTREEFKNGIRND